MDGDSNNPFDPESLREMWEKLGLGPAPDFSDPAAVIASMQGLLGQMPSNLSAQEAVRDVARKTVATAGPDPTPGLSARNRLQDASRLAQHWLDDATAFKTQSTDVQVWSRAEWVEATLPVWRSITTDSRKPWPGHERAHCHRRCPRRVCYVGPNGGPHARPKCRKHVFTQLRAGARTTSRIGAFRHRRWYATTATWSAGVPPDQHLGVFERPRNRRRRCAALPCVARMR